jgi:hypothetical protein
MSEDNPSSLALRQRFEREYALPLASAVFELEPRCQSVLVTVGQYWCDEATDAVHSEEIACSERDPTWPEAGQARRGMIGDGAALDEAFAAAAQDPDSDGPPGLLDVQYGLFKRARQRAFGQDYFSVLDDNTDMIVAFASYCREVSDQEQPSWRSHTPYGLVRRPLAGELPTLEVIGSMYRPQWEDRWDVLQTDGIISGLDEPAPDPRGASNDRLAAEPVVSSAPAKTIGRLPPGARVLLFLLLIAAVIAARGCWGK